MKAFLIYIAIIAGTIAYQVNAADSAEPELVLSLEFAHEFADEWIEAWNAHDLPRILSHYDDDFEMSSPLIRTLMNNPSGTLKGKSAVGAYWERALARAPDLHFTLESVLLGANSITLIYQGARGLSAEVFHISSSGKVSSAYAHYVVEL